MIMDASLIMFDNVAITAAKDSTPIDLGALQNVLPGYQAPSPNVRMPLQIFVGVSETFNTCDSVTIDVKSADTAAKAGSVTHVSSTVPRASLVAGTQPFGLFKLGAGVKEFLYITVTPAGTAPTNGRINAALVLDAHINK